MRKIFNTYTLIFTVLAMLVSTVAMAQSDGKVIVNSSDKIKHIVAKKRAHHRSSPKIDGFKIQLFNGSEDGAYKVRDEFSTLFPRIKVKIEFFSPEWKVRAGKFKTRLAAERSLQDVKEAFPSAFVLATKIDI